MDFDTNKLINNQFAIGAIGSVVGLKFVPGATLIDRVTNVAAGTLCAGFFAPALVEWVHVTSTGVSAAISFAVGMFGISLAAALAKAIKDLRLSEIISGWISRRG